MLENLAELIEASNQDDFVSCLLENLRNHSDSYYKMLKNIKEVDVHHYKYLSKGCQAAMEIYFALVDKENEQQ